MGTTRIGVNLHWGKVVPILTILDGILGDPRVLIAHSGQPNDPVLFVQVHIQGLEIVAHQGLPSYAIRAHFYTTGG